ncbi:MAG: NCS2 family permease [Myxococcota bacterium]|jgi:AGZA family xanthine/uracil permease-like MFS transporter|nr:NCS2 family permease [Myxococcota bacterium]
MRWFVRGDIDGFFGLALDNLVQLLVIDSLCRFVLGFPPELVHGRILPGVAVSLLVGNLFYAWQAKNLATQTGRSDICALPYGINTVSLFGYVFLVMLPAKLGAEASGAPNAAEVAWRAGLVACLGSGLIELGGSFFIDVLRKFTPRAALLSTLAGIAITFISLGFLFRTFANPVVGLTCLAVILVTYFGRVKFRGGLPGGLVAVALGTLLAWLTGLSPSGAAPSGGGFFLPIPVLGDLFSGLGAGELLTYLSVIVPMGIFNVVGSLQNIESAEAAGDKFPAMPSLAVNGLGTIAAACFGSCFPTTIYIGHPGWKALGARAGYSVLNAVAMTAICLTGTLAYIAYAVPIDAGMAIVLWIGIVISAQAFSATPREHAPAVVMGILPGIAAFGALMAKNGLRAAGVGMPDGKPFGDWLVEAFRGSDTWIAGVFSLEQGFIFTAMILSAATVEIIERRFLRASAWFAGAAVLSLIGLVHSYAFTPGDCVASLTPAWTSAIGYGAMAAVMAIAKVATVSDDASH